jgi:hypothetical protein
VKVIKLILSIVIPFYVIVAIFVTACLIGYNDYNITEFGKKSLIIVEDDSLKPYFNEGDLLVVTKNNNADVKVNDKIFFYNNYNKEVSVNLAKVLKTERITDSESTFTVDGNYDVSSEYFIGKEDTTVLYPKVGSVLNVLTSKYGYLFIFILPILLLFLGEIFAIIKEVKNYED